jgi:hypothetical protein
VWQRREVNCGASDYGVYCIWEGKTGNDEERDEGYGVMYAW